jgi:hypothetical protein
VRGALTRATRSLRSASGADADVLSDVEISRALNALATTLRDQRPTTFDVVRIQQIASGALAGEDKLEARGTGPAGGGLRRREDGRLVATIALHDGQWSVERKLRAGEPTRAIQR